MSMYEPWHGCHKYSEGCKYCYIHEGAYRKGINPEVVYKSKNFYKPIEKDSKGNYKMKSGFAYFCFQSDFLLEDADIYRNEVLDMFKQRQDITFLCLTKRIERFTQVMPKNFFDGSYNNIIICCTIENQKTADDRLPIYNLLPLEHKQIVIQPMLEQINISNHLDNIECVVVGGEEHKNARVLNYDWVLDIRRQCIEHNVDFEFRQCGTNFIKDGVLYKLSRKDLMVQARKANINIKNK